MHELGIVFNIIDAVEEVARGNAIERVSGVTLQLGEVSGIVPEYLTDCWRWACAKKPLMAGCELTLETVPALTYCEACGATYPTVANGKTCPHCGSARTYLVQGQETVIKEVTVDASDAPDAPQDPAPQDPAPQDPAPQDPAPQDADAPSTAPQHTSVSQG